MVLKSTLLLLKYILRDELRKHLPKILGLLRELTGKKTSMEYLETVLTYVSRGTDKVDEEDVRYAVEEAFPQIGGDIMPTLAEKWIKQGLQQGLQQGILQKSREAVIDILEVRFKVVPQSIVKTLNEISDPSILKILHRKAVEVKSLEEVGHLIDLMK